MDAGEVRAYVRRLSRQGVGYKSVADAAGVSRTGLAAVLRGDRGQVRAQTARRILAVDRRAVAGGALIAAGPTWRLLNELIGRGYTRGQIARWLGATRPALQIRQNRVTAKTAAKVEKLYRLLQQGKLARSAA